MRLSVCVCVCAGGSPSIYFLTTVLTEVISNAATVTLMFPIAYETVTQGYISTKAMTYTLMMAGSSSFCTPIGYQVRPHPPCPHWLGYAPVDACKARVRPCTVRACRRLTDVG
jgi:hypothetical protein